MKLIILIIFTISSFICQAQFHLELNETQVRAELQREGLTNVVKKYSADGTFHLLARFPEALEMNGIVVFDDHNISYKFCMVPDNFDTYKALVQSYKQNKNFAQYSNTEWRLRMNNRIIKIVDNYVASTNSHIFYFTFIN